MNPRTLQLALTFFAVIVNVVVCVLIVILNTRRYRFDRDLLKRVEALEEAAGLIRDIFTFRKAADAPTGDSVRSMGITITCPMCGMTSHNPDDVLNGYCGNCHAYTTPRRQYERPLRNFELMDD